MRIYDDNGNMVDTEVGEFSVKLHDQVTELFEKLFAEGMTVLEARGLIGYLQASIEYSAIFQIMYAQMDAAGIEREDNDDSCGFDNGAATARAPRDSEGCCGGVKCDASRGR